MRTSNPGKPEEPEDRTEAGSDLLSERISAEILKGILDGVWPSGSRLKLSDLAKRYNVSVMPIREALWKLEATGLIQNIPNKGAVVCAIDERRVMNIYELRRAIETQLLECAATIATTSDFKRIRAAQKDFEDAVRSGGAARIMAADTNFHHSMNVIADNEFMLRVLHTSAQLTRVVRARIGFDQERLSEIIAEHHAIIIAFEAGDVKALQRAAIIHSNGALQNILAAIDNAKLAAID